MRVTTQPYDPGPAAWNALLPDSPAHAPLDGDITADVLVIGAGFTGLTAARRLNQLDPNLNIVVLEARRVAEGPAGRNSGFMIDLPHNLSSKDYAGAKASDLAQTHVNRAAIAFAEQAANDLNMGTEAFALTGKINAAATTKGDAHNRDYVSHLDAMGEPHELLDAVNMRAICGSSYYRSGLFTPGTAMLQPALYIRNLARGIIERGVMLHEASPVIDLSNLSDNWHAKTPSGTVTAPSVVLATNGHAESFGLFKRRLMHVYLYASMTRAMCDNEVSTLGGRDRWAFTPADPMGTTVRRISGTGGTRIVVRNGFTWAPERVVTVDRLALMKRAHRRSFDNRFPALKAVEMEHVWGGLLCLSRNNAPAYGEVQPGLFSACCQNGLGTAMGTAAGMAIAERILGVSSHLDEHFSAQPAPSKLPPPVIANIGANAVLRWKEQRAGREL
ncbi:FAD-binding oxidoreductase [Ahrensia sp. R2A130]|uniref:NAD(P)/FAD-dependent oxidoreductase n=1 Tax=Ahrensia sp. R2A130 TaxID=744979 RepID=UPI0001E0B4EC|nr:FAD-binding oxidoreductase [Ahrensia sp. R2A130]EFL88472.1 oxidoreductase, NAD-binding site [Ahrensia sp. R2A130]